MAKHNELGKYGETLAAAFLEQKSYIIIGKNSRFGRLEVDIIAQTGDILVFVEVKTRKNNVFGYPESAVTPRKQGLMIAAAAAYMEQNSYSGEIRFDIISITLNEPEPEILHFEDAFFPHW